MTKRLTKEMLEEMGIREVRWDPEHSEHQWIIMREWYPTGKVKEKKLIPLKITLARGKNKYTTPKIYLKVQFSYQGKSYSYPLGRFVYAWHKGVVEDGLDIDHKNNCPYDNHLDNLQPLTRLENIRKRYTDNPEGCWNQYEACKKYCKKIR